MKCHRINEVIELLSPEWEKNSTLNLAEMLQKLATDAGFTGPLNELTDDVLIYHLKMLHTDKHEAIPGIKKDYEEDFKSALLKARGVIKD